MTLPAFPAQMVKNGEVDYARDARSYWNLYWQGWRPVGSPVPVNDDDGFSDAAVAALIDNMSSQTWAALERRLVSKQKLVIQENPPSSPTPGTVWIDTAP